MAEYVKRVRGEKKDQEEFYHWNKDCSKYPKRGRETVLIFKKRPSHIPPCPECTELDNQSER